MKLERTIVTRGYELDRTGAVPPTVVVRYLEHLRWEALREPGTGMAGMFERGRSIVVRSQSLEMLARIPHAQELTLGMWVERVGRTSLVLAHDVRGPDGALLATATVLAVHIDRSGRPAAIPDALRSTARLPDPPVPSSALDMEAPADAVVRTFRVRPHELDLLQHVNHAIYLEYFEDARLLAAADGAFGEASRVASRPLRGVAIDYLRSALPGATLRTLAFPIPGLPSVFGFELRLAQGEGAVLSRGRIIAEPL